MVRNRVCSLLKIKVPVIQAGMVWCSGWELASAISNAGGLGVIGSGSMYPEVLREQIRKCKQSTPHPFAVNIPLLYAQIGEHIQTIIDEKVPIVISSAGNPSTWTEKLKSHGVIVIHVVSSARFAKKAENCGVDIVVAEGFEAGGHNGREETTSFCLIPQVCETVKIPVVAAGGIGSGRSMFAAMALGAEGVQIGSRFVASIESSAHLNFKNAVIEAGEGSTELTLKELTPVRLLKNPFYLELQEAYAKGANAEELKNILGKGRAKKGMFEGDLVQGELEIGQISALISSIQPAAEILLEITDEFKRFKEGISTEDSLYF